MRILKAQVVSTQDKTQTGRFFALCPAVSNDYITVTYTSPFYTRNGGGMLAIPDPGSEILIWEDETEYYYVSTIIKPSEPGDGNNAQITKFKTIEDREIYTERNKPQKVTYEDQNGAGLSISNNYVPNKMAIKTEVKSRLGKKLLLSDAPDMDYIHLRNEHGDGVVITSDKTPFHSAQSIEIKCLGPQRIVSYQGSQDMVLVDGTDINMINHSTGVNADPVRQKQTGNVNFESVNRDVNIVAGKRVFIITPKARIQINEDGSIDVQALAGINVNSIAPIKLKSNISIELDAPIVNLNTQSLITGAGATTMTTPPGGGAVSMVGGLVPLPLNNPDRNAYGK